MIYLKYFNESKLYNRISTSDDSLVDFRNLKFTDIEISKIEKVCLKNNYDMQFLFISGNPTNDFMSSSRDAEPMQVIKMSPMYNKKQNIQCLKFEDEWYRISINNYDGDVIWYKCDSFDGVLQLIEDSIYN